MLIPVNDQKDRNNAINSDEKSFHALNNSQKRLLLLIWFIIPILVFSFLFTPVIFNGHFVPFDVSSPKAAPQTPENCTDCHIQPITATHCEDCHNGTFAVLPNTTLLAGNVNFLHHNVPDGTRYLYCNDSNCHGASSDYRFVDHQAVNMTEYCDNPGCHSTGSKTDNYNPAPGQCGECHLSNPKTRARPTTDDRTVEHTLILSGLLILLITVGVIVIIRFIIL